MSVGPLSLLSRSADETRRLGQALGSALRPGDVVSLTGDLGAGKTCLVQGAAGALGVEEPVSSPTFVLVREYGGRVPVYHVDVYRLDRIQEVHDLGWEDLLDAGGVVFIEWGSAIAPLLPPTHLEVVLTIPGADDIRELQVLGHGVGWSGRWPELEERLRAWGGRLMLVLAIETSTPQTTVALGTEQGVLGSVLLSWGKGHSEIVVPAVHQLLEWTEVELRNVGGVAVGLGPGLFTGLRVGVSTARALAQVLHIPLVGVASLDILAFAARHSRWRIGAVTDAKRGEVFYAFYRPVPGGVARESEYAVGSPERLVAELEATREETLLVGGGALLYRRILQEAAPAVEFGSVSTAFPLAVSLVELAVPRFHREEFSRPEAVVPYYVRKSDAEINWARAARSA